jgi:hypothetical protein
MRLGNDNELVNIKKIETGSCVKHVKSEAHCKSVLLEAEQQGLVDMASTQVRGNRFKIADDQTINHEYAPLGCSIKVSSNSVPVGQYGLLGGSGSPTATPSEPKFCLVPTADQLAAIAQAAQDTQDALSTAETNSDNAYYAAEAAANAALAARDAAGAAQTAQTAADQAQAAAQYARDAARYAQDAKDAHDAAQAAHSAGATGYTDTFLNWDDALSFAATAQTAAAAAAAALKTARDAAAQLLGFDDYADQVVNTVTAVDQASGLGTIQKKKVFKSVYNDLVC